VNRARATAAFLDRVEFMMRLPFVDDVEMEGLFGAEVAATLLRLDALGAGEGLCRDCASRCCLACRCELYAPEFGRCSVHELRPVVCRLHYCHRFHLPDSSAVVALGDIFFDSLVAADRAGSTKVRLFDSPPLESTAPGLVAVAASLVASVKDGSLDPEHAAGLILAEARRVGTPDADGAPVPVREAGC
jgi:hypothetical protein